MDVPANVIWPDLDDCKFLAIKPTSLMEGLMVAGSVFKGDSFETLVRIINVSDHDKTLKKGLHFTDAEPVELAGEVNQSKHKQFCKNISSSTQNSDTIPEHLKCIYDDLKKTLKEEELEQALKFLKKNADVFSSHDLDLGRTDLVKHTIDTGDHRPIKQQLRRHPHAHLPLIDEAVEEMLKYDIVEKSSSPWASNLLMVKKKDADKWRTCVDFRHLNVITKKDSYPLPRIDACFDALG